MSETQQIPLKRENGGRFAKGNHGGAGRPVAGMQSFKDRLSHWLDTKTLKEIQTIVEDEKKFGKLLSIDAMVARRIAQACKANGGMDFQMILDRLLGKPAITADLQVTHALASRLDAAEQALAVPEAIPLISEIIHDEENN